MPIQQDSIGTRLLMTVKDQNGTPVPVPTMTKTSALRIRKANGSVLSKDVTFFTDGNDGKLSYVAIDGDFDVQGTYQIQALIVIPGSGSWPTSIFELPVLPNVTDLNP